MGKRFKSKGSILPKTLEQRKEELKESKPKEDIKPTEVKQEIQKTSLPKSESKEIKEKRKKKLGGMFGIKPIQPKPKKVKDNKSKKIEKEKPRKVENSSRTNEEPVKKKKVIPKANKQKKLVNEFKSQCHSYLTPSDLDEVKDIDMDYVTWYADCNVNKLPAICELNAPPIIDEVSSFIEDYNYEVMEEPSDIIDDIPIEPKDDIVADEPVTTSLKESSPKARLEIL